MNDKTKAKITLVKRPKTDVQKFYGSQEGEEVKTVVRLPSESRGCEGKMRMSLKESPHLKAQELAKKYNKDFGVYLCLYCDKYHLTSKLEKQREYAPLEYQTNLF